MSLLSLLQYTNASGGGGGGTVDVSTVVVYNTNKDSENNGGCCCLWTVPTGATWFQVEMWGGGGSGGHTCCCQAGWSGGSGTYIKKIVTTVAAQEYRICAGGSTNCGNTGSIGCKGCPSYIYGITEAANVACAEGGLQGGTRCYFGSNCSYQGCSGIQCGSGCGTMILCGVGGIGQGYASCWNQTSEFMPSAPMTHGGYRRTKDGCSGFCGGCCNGGYAHWPGGGGSSTHSHTTGPFCGAAGAGGLVVVTYAVTS